LPAGRLDVAESAPGPLGGNHQRAAAAKHVQGLPQYGGLVRCGAVDEDGLYLAQQGARQRVCRQFLLAESDDIAPQQVREYQ
jgi:hypothetical protein